jgi:drug/metabolite transporter (DMT)-like permease
MITRLIGIALILAGIGLAFWGYQISETLTVQLTSKVTGSMPDEVLYRYIAGGACGIAGLFLALKG